MDETALRLGIGELIAAYADCIDDDRLEEWPDFFVENCRYLITDRESHAAGLRHGIIYAASRGMLTDRVMAMRPRQHLRGAALPPYRRSGSHRPGRARGRRYARQLPRGAHHA